MEGQSLQILEVSSTHLIFAISNEIKWKVKVVLLEVSLMNFILRILKEIKWKVKVVLLEISLMNFIRPISKATKWKGKVVLIEVLLMNVIPGYPMRSNRRWKHGVTRGIIYELNSSDIQGDEMEGESMLLLEVSSMRSILAISYEIKWKVKMVLLEAC